jgi:hypothetical protein
MIEYIDSIRQSITQGNWYGALFMALAMPDICGAAEQPGTGKVKKRYTEWCDKYLVDKYIINKFGQQTVFLTSEECYYFRCALLHEGGSYAPQTDKHIMFVAPTSVTSVHCNIIHIMAGELVMEKVIQFSIDLFCEDMCSSVERWLSDVAGNPDIQSRLANRLTVIVPVDGFITIPYVGRFRAK